MSAVRSLVQLLGLGRRSVVALAGAGGKTTTMWTLARSLARQGRRVACTTTTRIARGQEPEGVQVVPFHHGEMGARLAQVLDSGCVPVVLTSDTDDGKTRGITTDQADRLASLVDHLIIEADGARMLPLKIPRAHEPPVPDSTTHLVVMVGLAALDREASSEVVFHHEDLVTRGLLEPGRILDPRTIRSLLVSDHGYLPHMGRGRESFFAVNGPDLRHCSRLARELWYPSIRGCLAVDARRDRGLVVDNAGHRVCALVLAAGVSSRFGENKMLHRVDGQPMVRRPVRAALDASMDDVVVVVGHEADSVTQALGTLVEHARVRVVRNRRFAEGMSTSLRAGIGACRDRADAVMVLLGDMPAVDELLVRDVLAAYRAGAALVAAPHLGQRTGHPVILSAQLFDQVGELQADRGAREIVRRVMDRAALVTLGGNRISTQRDVDSASDV